MVQIQALMNHGRKFQEPASFEDLMVLVLYICLCCFIGVGIVRGVGGGGVN